MMKMFVILIVVVIQVYTCQNRSNHTVQICAFYCTSIKLYQKYKGGRRIQFTDKGNGYLYGICYQSYGELDKSSHCKIVRNGGYTISKHSLKCTLTPLERKASKFGPRLESRRRGCWFLP